MRPEALPTRTECQTAVWEQFLALGEHVPAEYYGLRDGTLELVCTVYAEDGAIDFDLGVGTVTVDVDVGTLHD